MGRRRSFTPLNVFLNTPLVGQLLREKSGAISFVYDRSWLDWEHRMPISLSLPLREGRFSGGNHDIRSDCDFQTARTTYRQMLT
ncbi:MULTISPECIES: HipA N-terminal domain-containing protein [Rhodovulum]|uniref:HipA-like protein n=2 Tax=Rhodovulum TaxID=34008 RepID=A0A8E2VHI8_9RHOB|nr:MULTISPECIES: HipA N-terminal domain-containing protein [Rhodovulum]PTW37222.1 HipA-like protein [Rhodovulum kholense]RAP39597.1 hypothetical protein BYZ73_19750 [Rhodovulum viride]